jgi:hypothetical protein
MQTCSVFEFWNWLGPNNPTIKRWVEDTDSHAIHIHMNINRIHLIVIREEQGKELAHETPGAMQKHFRRLELNPSQVQPDQNECTSYHIISVWKNSNSLSLISSITDITNSFWSRFALPTQPGYFPTPNHLFMTCPPKCHAGPRLHILCTYALFLVLHSYSVVIRLERKTSVSLLKHFSAIYL